jgi:hypothetical protein
MNRALPAAPDDAAPVERRVSWLMAFARVALDTFGHEPRPAENVPGEGMLGQLAGVVVEREEAKRVTSTRRSMIVGIVTGASMALGIVGGVVALMKALGL